MDSTESTRVHPSRAQTFHPSVPGWHCVTGAQAPGRTGGQGPADTLAVWLWREMGLQLEGDRWDAGADFIFYNKIKSCLYADGNDLVDRLN